MFPQYGNLYRTIADIKFKCKCVLYAYYDETQSDKGKTYCTKCIVITKAIKTRFVLLTWLTFYIPLYRIIYRYYMSA